MSPRSSTVMTAILDSPTRMAAALFLSVALTIAVARAQDSIVATVNGEPITAQDVEQRSKLLEASSPSHTAPSRQEALDTLIDEKLVAPTARRLHLAPADFIKIGANSPAHARFQEYLQEMRRQAQIEYRQ
jgi:hypothetical protein